MISILIFIVFLIFMVWVIGTTMSLFALIGKILFEVLLIFVGYCIGKAIQEFSNKKIKLNGERN